MANRNSARRSAARKGATKAKGTTKRLRGVPGYLSSDGPGEFDRLVHERVRLGVLSALSVNHTLSFSELKRLLSTTDGNLSVHARKLEEAGYIDCHKSFERRLPRTEYKLTAKGRRSLQRYLDHMEALIHATRDA